MNTTEFLLLVQSALNSKPELLNRVTKVEIQWKAHPKGECSETFLPDIKIELAASTSEWDD